MEITNKIEIKCIKEELVEVIKKQLEEGNELTYVSVSFRDLIADGNKYKKTYSYNLSFEKNMEEETNE